MMKSILLSLTGIALLSAYMTVVADNPPHHRTEKADLVVLPIHHTYAQLAVHQFDTFQVSVRNAGNKKSPPSKLKFQTGGSFSLMDIPEIEPNHSFSVSKRVSFDCAGTYGITVVADVDNAVNEWNENNNTGGIVIKVVDEGGPDLYISDISWTDPEVNKAIHISVTVMNKLGSGVAPATKLRFRIGGEDAPPLYNIPSLAPGQNYSVSRNFTASQEGNFMITATADARNDAPNEKNEGNNVQSKILIVKLLPDLVVCLENLVMEAIDYKHSIWAHVKNIGPGQSSPCKLRWYVKENGVVEKDVPALAVGQSKTYYRDITWYTIGNKKMEATIDSMFAVKETNEYNNHVIENIHAYTMFDIPIIPYEELQAMKREKCSDEN